MILNRKSIKYDCGGYNLLEQLIRTVTSRRSIILSAEVNVRNEVWGKISVISGYLYKE